MLIFSIVVTSTVLAPLGGQDAQRYQEAHGDRDHHDGQDGADDGGLTVLHVPPVLGARICGTTHAIQGNGRRRSSGGGGLDVTWDRAVGRGVGRVAERVAECFR